MPPILDTLPWAIGVLAGAASVLLLVGPRIVRVADRLADVTGLGEALMGGVFIGAVTSLPDLLATITPALRGLPDLAVGNALGGVLGQTFFLAIADLSYRRANLEHAAASLSNIVQGMLLITLLSFLIVLFHVPSIAIFGVHPWTLLLFAGYGYGLHLLAQISKTPMWRAVLTSETRLDVPADNAKGETSLSGLWLRFVVFGIILAITGWLLGRAGETIAMETGLTETAVGVLLTGLSSSLPELVVSVAAVRAGAFTLAVGNIIGGNTFDSLLVGVADIAYREGSIYSAVSPTQSLIAGLAALATAVVIFGMLRRERHGVGVANLGMESIVVIVIYAIAVLLIV